MGALTAVTPTNAGVLTSGAAVAATDTIARSAMGPKGVYLEIINGGGSPDNITISDSGSTPSGNAIGTYPATVTNGTSKVFYIHPDQAVPATGLVTITHSFITSVTYKLYTVD